MNPDISVELMTQMLRTMMLARSLDNAATNLQRQGELALWPSLLGQEGAHAGVAAALHPSDVVFPTYREQGVLLARGITPKELLGLYRGTTLGGWDPYTHGCFLTTIVIAAQCLHGVGYAMGIVRDAQRIGSNVPPGRAVLVCLGDGSLSEGEANEAFVWAATHNLPVVFYCQNNQWAISSPTSVQSRVPLVDRGLGFGIPGVSVDGNNAAECYKAADEALTRARNGGGPTFIEALTYRMNAHTTSDDDMRYRTEEDKQVWRDRDPIPRAIAQLQNMTDRADVIVSGIEQEAQELDQEVRQACRAMPDPDPMDPFTYTLTSMTNDLAAQSATFLRHYDRDASQ
jgi:pyruvate dehydrogenase E1 component alpha subunit